MRLFSPGSLIFLDFDGVLCDSLEECYRSSWLASIGWDGEEVPPDPPFDAAYRARFDACRPYIRSGEDYLVVHEWAALGIVPSSQAEFDASLDDKGRVVLDGLKTKLYGVRDLLLENHRALWLSWNPLYPGIAEALRSQAANAAVRILSTKKAEFILEIVLSQGVDWPLERTLYTGARTKLDIIDEIAGGEPSVLIDDQVDHLDFEHPTCRCFLALWGYVSENARERAEAALTLDEAVAAISSL
jgi:hypothetical protein